MEVASLLYVRSVVMVGRMGAADTVVTSVKAHANRAHSLLSNLIIDGLSLLATRWSGVQQRRSWFWV